MASQNYSAHELLDMLEAGGLGPASDRVRATMELAYKGHKGQFRDTRSKDVQVPFIVHPVGTALLAVKHFSDVERELDDTDLETIVCVALAHDLLEDTGTDPAVLERIAGTRVRTLVEALTKPPAGVAGRGKDARNREFIQQMLSGGPAAVYVKMCDSMHNMSRPNMTPAKLFRKTVEKARKLYLPMLSQCDLGRRFEQVFIESLTKAEREAIEEERFVRDAPAPCSLDEAVRESVVASTRKVLELHDLTAILHRICQTHIASIWRVGGKRGDILKLVSTSVSETTEEQTWQFSSGDSPQVLDGQAIKKFPLVDRSVSSEIYAIPIQFAPGRSFVCALVFKAGSAPKWLSLEAASLMVQFLAHRLIVSESDRRARVTAEAARLGMRIDPELAAESGLTPSDLQGLNIWRRRCQQAVKIVEGLLDFYLWSDDSREEIRRSIQIETRVKTVNSILTKLIHRIKSPASQFESIEDVAGVRVVLPTICSLQELRRFLLGQRANSAGCRLHSSIERPERDWVDTPTKDGYRAVHLILEVDTFLKDGGSESVPCEVQLRTTFQHVWAAIAHRTTYGTASRDPEATNALKEMGEALRHCEELNERIEQTLR